MSGVTRPVYPPMNAQLTNLAGLALGSLCTGGLFGVVARLFTHINPVAGVVYGATLPLSDALIEWGCEKAEIPLNNTAARVAKFFAKAITGTVVTVALGFPFSLKAAIILPLITAGIIAGTVVCIAAATVTALIASKMITENLTFEEAIRSLTQEAFDFAGILVQQVGDRTGLDLQPVTDVINEGQRQVRRQLERAP